MAAKRPSKRARQESTYDPEVAAAVCARIADGESLRAICRDPDMPAESTFRLWVVDDRDGVAARYARARQAQALRWAEEILEIADAEHPRDAAGRIDGGAVQQARLQVDSRKWLLCKVLPKVYGDKIAVSGDPDGSPIRVAAEDVEKEIVALFEEVKAKVKAKRKKTSKKKAKKATKARSARK